MVQIVEMTNILGSIHKPRVDQEGEGIKKLAKCFRNSVQDSKCKFSWAKHLHLKSRNLYIPIFWNQNFSVL